MTTQTTTIASLTGDNEKKKFRGHCESIIQAIKEKESLNEDIKSYLTSIEEEFGLKKKLVRKAIKTFMDQALEDARTEQTEVEKLVDVLSTGTPPASNDE